MAQGVPESSAPGSGRVVMTLPVRLQPGQDLRQGLEEAARAASVASAFVICGIGSLTDPRLRFADAREETLLPGAFELVSLSGTLTPGGCHLHMMVAGPDGRVWGGHVSRGNTIRTTAEVLLAALPDGVLSRRFDPRTGFMELVVQEPIAGGAHGAAAQGRAP